jgi:hypothetical protein
MLQQEVTALEDSKRKADRKARASIWQRVAAVFGADKIINDLRKKLKQQEEQLKAVEAERRADAAKYKAEVEKARQTSQKPLRDLLQRIGTKLGITPSSSRNNYTEGAVMLKLDEHLEHERMWNKRMNDAEDILKKQDKASKQEQSQGLSR